MKRTVFRYYEIATEIKLEPYKREFPNDRRLGIQALRKDHETLACAIIEAESAVPTAEFASADAAIAHLKKHFPEMLVQDFGHYARVLAATVEEVELTVDEDGTVMDTDNMGTVEMSAFPAD